MSFKKVDVCKFKVDQVNIKIEMKGRVGNGRKAVKENGGDFEIIYFLKVQT